MTQNVITGFVTFVLTLRLKFGSSNLAKPIIQL